MTTAKERIFDMNAYSDTDKEISTCSGQLIAPGDYFNKTTGLLMCGKCGGKKECMSTFLGTTTVVPCLCQCKKEALKLEQDRKKQKELRVRIEAMRRDGLPDALQTKTFASSQDSEQMQMARNYVEHWDEVQNENTGLLFWGSCRSGKTHTAACIANALIDKGVSAGIISLSVLPKIPFEERELMIYKMLQKSLVIIDDLGSERKTEYFESNVLSIIESRLNAGKPMIITTNLTLDTFKHPDGLQNARIYSRIYEKCTGIKFEDAGYCESIHEKNRETLSKILFD